MFLQKHHCYEEVSTLNSNVTRLKFSIEFSPSFSTSQDYSLTVKIP